MLLEQPPVGVAPRLRPGGVEPRLPQPSRPVDVASLLGMEAAALQGFGDLVEASPQRELAEKREIGGTVAADELRPGEDAPTDQPEDRALRGGPPRPCGRSARGPAPSRAEAWGERARGQGADVVLLAPRVDRANPGEAQHDLRVPVEDLDAPREEGGRGRIVVPAPLEVLASRELEDPVVVSGGAQVLRIPEIADSGIARRVPPADRLRCVGGRVVGDDQLEYAKRLREDGIQRLGEIFLAVVDGQPDADPKSSRRLFRSHPLLSAPAHRSVDRSC
jgi:hypothetical protein